MINMVMYDLISYHTINEPELLTRGYVMSIQNVFALMRSYMKCLKHSDVVYIVSHISYGKCGSISKYKCDRQGKITRYE